MRGIILSTAADVLARREQRRDEHAHALARWDRPLVSITLVAPGARKDSPALRRAHSLAVQAVLGLLAARGWAVLASGACSGVTGPESWHAVDADPRALKSALVALEDAPGTGRVWDLDVIVASELGPAPIGRGALGLPPRRCLLCAETAHACARARRHPLPVVVAAADAVASGWPSPGDALWWAGLAAEALRVEARLTPKPGLVDAANSGSHDDMDLALLLASADALEPWFAGCVLLGRASASAECTPASVSATADGVPSSAALTARPPVPRGRLVSPEVPGPRASSVPTDEPGSDFVRALTELGIAAERSMLAVTGGVNTHKGALFSMGLLLAAIGRTTSPGEAPSIEVVLDEAARLASGINAAWRAGFRDAHTHGERALLTTGAGGIRAEAAAGFPAVRDVALPAYRARRQASGGGDSTGLASGPTKDALRWALVSLMSTVEDTNLIARGGIEALTEVRPWATGLLASDPSETALIAALAEADEHFTARRWSPGGSADLLALTWFLDEMPRLRPTAHPDGQ
ncbi:MAG: citrate lyase holo-[acyl-carrier protein] synthase [Propioniciclava sp.]|uniref:citrate lyase holo-[acyl-carrier protein] synthase n=1 Tax=Propioniciclava sp. TaxID=2038686 RepID=UPI0039E4F694